MNAATGREQAARHIEVIRALSQPGQPLAPDAPTASIYNPAWFNLAAPNLAPIGARKHLHEVLRAQATSAPADHDRQAIVLAGPPGAGKSTVMRQITGEMAATFLALDADEFKIMLLDEALRDGSYESWLKPAEVRALEAQGERFFPLEMASLVHEESSFLTRLAQHDALAAGINVVIDTVLSDANKALDLGRRLTQAGYSIRVIDVEVPYEVSHARIVARWEQAYLDGLAGRAQLGGRWVPSEFTRSVFDGPGGRSCSEIAAERLAHDCPAVTRFQRFRTTVEDGQLIGPVLETDQAGDGLHLASADRAANIGAQQMGLGPAAMGTPASQPSEPQPPVAQSGQAPQLGL